MKFLGERERTMRREYAEDDPNSSKRRRRTEVPKPNRPFENSIRPFGLIFERYSSPTLLPLFPLIPHRCRFLSQPRVKKGEEGKRGRERLNFDSPAIRVSLEGAYFIHFEARNIRVVASKFRERERSEKDAQVDDGWLINF